MAEGLGPLGAALRSAGRSGTSAHQAFVLGVSGLEERGWEEGGGENGDVRGA